MFMQNGVPVNFSLRAREWLQKHLPGRWNGRWGPKECAVRSTDIALLDFDFLAICSISNSSTNVIYLDQV